MTQDRQPGLLADAVVQAEAALPAGWRGLTVLDIAQAETAPLDELPVARRISLSVDPSHALLRPVSLPMGADAARALPIWLEEVSPWAAGHYLWDAVKSKEGMGWVVAILPRSACQSAEDRLERRGSEVVEITVTAPDGQVFRLRRDEQGRKRLRRGLSVLAGTLAAVGIALTVWQGQAALTSRDAARKAQIETEALQKESTTGSATSAALAFRAAQAAVPPMAERLAFLAARVPLDTWLLHLSLAGTKFTLSGLSAAPERIIPALTGGTGPIGADGVDFDGAIARDSQTGLFSFTITGALTLREGP